jgi:hypothetical protein
MEEVLLTSAKSLKIIFFNLFYNPTKQTTENMSAKGLKTTTLSMTNLQRNGKSQ